MNEFVRVEHPSGTPLPVVFDSPHSGSVYPDDFGHALDRMVLRRSEDAHIEELFAHVTKQGATMVHALFPRCYIDPNRNEDDIDLDMIDGDWPGPVNPSAKTIDRGVGLIWKKMRVQGAVYDRKLSPAEAAGRIKNYWRPYHETLRQQLNEAVAAHGFAIHIDCHSMSGMGDAETEDGAVQRPDFVIGDRDGTTCAPEVTACVVEVLRDLGYSVAVNYPYKGMELIRRHGRPHENRHAIQIEINRSLYMDEGTMAKTEGFLALRRNLETLTGAICALCDTLREERADAQ
ncbi:N-formylglutamate amidohydrolase [uncultured Ruegeria sp.]|uniref:N-formylglutamate amidohydrolase n=1 Tax=uncultured Ruegeria sp. TaxID=259304 RepID=UPI002635B6B3|nr:N-formylglutamate amidohydrolase [uncultured Ruegeria sp.]